MALSYFGDIIRYIAAIDVGGSFFKYAGETENPAVRLALLAGDSGKASEFLNRFRFPSKIKRLVLKLTGECVQPRNSAEVSRLLEKFECDIETAAEYVRIQKLIYGDTGAVGGGDLLGEFQRIKDSGIPYKISMLPVNGNDLLAYGIEACNVGNVLKTLLEEVRLGRISGGREALLEFLKLNY